MARRFQHGGSAAVRKLRKEASIVARNLLRDLRRGNCHAAHGWMHQLNRINAMIPNYTTGIKNAPFVPSKGTLLRLRRVYGARCSVSYRSGVSR